MSMMSTGANLDRARRMSTNGATSAEDLVLGDEVWPDLDSMKLVQEQVQSDGAYSEARVLFLCDGLG